MVSSTVALLVEEKAALMAALMAELLAGKKVEVTVGRTEISMAVKKDDLSVVAMVAWKG